MKALIITGRGVQDQELVYPLHRLQEAGYKVIVAADAPEFHGFQGVRFKAHASIEDEAEVVDDYHAVVVPGGVKCMEHLRLNAAALHIVREQHRRGGVVAAICSGAQLLISAGLVRGRMVSGYPAIQIDIENAGAKFHEGPVCVFDRIVTAPHYDQLGPWMAAVLREVEKARKDTVAHA
jgi:protease I